MTFLQKNAQELFALDPSSPASQLPAADTNLVSEVHHHHHFENPESEDLIEVDPDQVEEGSVEIDDPVDIEIVVEELPGAPSGTKDPEPVIEVIDEHAPVEEQLEANDTKKNKNEKWDWSSQGAQGFINWVKERLASVPNHSGYDSAGLERAIAYMERLDNEISKAMRMDLDAELDANKIEEVRSKLDEGLSRLQARLDKVKKAKKSSRKKKADYEFIDEGFVKEGQKILGVQGVYITVPLLVSGLARVCINGTVSAGHDIEDLYSRQVDRWKLSEREQFELRQLLFDMGYPIRTDRGFMPDDNIEISSSDNMDWAANYKA